MSPNSLAEIFRHIQYLTQKSELNNEEFYELEFYKALAKLLENIFTPGFISNFVEISIPIGYVNYLQPIALSYGFKLAIGCSGTVYLDWSKHIG